MDDVKDGVNRLIEDMASLADKVTRLQLDVLRSSQGMQALKIDMGSLSEIGISLTLEPEEIRKVELKVSPKDGESGIPYLQPKYFRILVEGGAHCTFNNVRRKGATKWEEEQSIQNYASAIGADVGASSHFWSCYREVNWAPFGGPSTMVMDFTNRMTKKITVHASMLGEQLYTWR